jgi:hypothetical protein
MKTRLLYWALGFVLTAVATEATAAGAALCREYATGAVRAYKTTQEFRKCARLVEARWHSNYGIHYGWCLRVDVAKLRVEQSVRDSYLTGCGAIKPKSTPTSSPKPKSTPMSNPVGVPINE